MAFSGKAKLLADKLRELQFVGDEPITEEHVSMMIAIHLAANNYDKFDEVIDIIDSNPGKSFSEISQIITKSGLFPQIRFAYDDEYAEDDENYDGA